MSSFLGQCLVVLVCLFFTGGCIFRPGILEKPKPVIQTEWHRDFQNRLERLQTYQATLYIKAESPKGNFASRAVVLAALPNRLRLEAFNLFGQTTGLLIVNELESSLWIPSEKVVYTAAEAQTLIASLLGVSIPVDALEYGLIGCIPLNQLDVMTISSGNSDAVGVANDPNRGWSLRWEFGNQPPSLKSLLVSDGAHRYTVTYDPPVDLKQQSNPKKIIFHSPPQWRMEVTIEQMKSSPVLGPATFNPSFPSDIRRINLDITK